MAKNECDINHVDFLYMATASGRVWEWNVPNWLFDSFFFFFDIWPLSDGAVLRNCRKFGTCAKAIGVVH